MTSEGAYEWWLLKSHQRRVVHLAAVALFTLTVLCFILIFHRNSNSCYKRRNICNCNLIVPDIIHFYRGDLDAVNISRSEGACLKAASRLHEQVWIHSTNTKSTNQELRNLGLTSPVFKVLETPYGPGPVHLNILRKYGGIYMKNDIYLLDRLDHMRGHDWSSAGQGDIVAGTKEGVANGRLLKLRDILLDKNYGALYIRDLMQNCSYSAVRLGIR